MIDVTGYIVPLYRHFSVGALRIWDPASSPLQPPGNGHFVGADAVPPLKMFRRERPRIRNNVVVSITARICSSSLLIRASFYADSQRLVQ